MRPRLLDTNLYVEALRGDAAAEALTRFYRSFRPQIFLSSVVAQELLAGAVGPRARRQIFEGLVQPFEQVGRVLTPSHRAWKRAGEVVASGALSPGGFGRGFVNDCLIATSAREHGCMVITRNLRDFDLIRKVEAVDFAPPWPAAARVR